MGYAGVRSQGSSVLGKETDAHLENQGCDATTYGLVDIDDTEFIRFKTFIENLNKNSYYGCMPVISVFRIDANDVKKINYNPNAEVWDDDYVEKENVFSIQEECSEFNYVPGFKCACYDLSFQKYLHMN